MNCLSYKYTARARAIGLGTYIRIPLPIPQAVTAVSLWRHDQMRHLRRLAHSRSTLSKRVPVSVTDCTNWSVLDSNRGSTQEHVDTRRLYTKSTRETLC